MKAILASISFLALFMLHVDPAYADWGSYGASYSCDSERQRFAIMSDIDSSAGYIGSYEAQVERYLKRLDGGAHRLECRLGNFIVRVTVTVSEPNTHMCQGAGHSWFSDIEVNGEAISLDSAPRDGRNYPLDGTYGCDHDPSPAAIKVIFEPKLVSICLSTSGDWEVDAKSIRCRSAAMRTNTPLERTGGR